MRFKTTSPAEPPLFDAAFIKRMERMVLQARRQLRGGLSGEHPSRRRLPAPTFSDHRPYVSGDDLRHIDWPAYARSEELHLKLGETEQDVHVAVGLDCSASLDWGDGDTHKGRYALRLAALIGAIALASNDQTHIWPFQRQGLQPFGPTIGRGQTPQLLRYLAKLPFGNATGLESIAERSRHYTGGILVIISDLWTTSLDHLLKEVRVAWQPIVLHLLHPDEIRPPLQGALELEDSETGALLELDATPEALKAYHQRLVRHIRAIEQTCRQRGATYVGVRTDRSLEQGIVPLLRRRAVLG